MQNYGLVYHMKSWYYNTHMPIRSLCGIHCRFYGILCLTLVYIIRLSGTCRALFPLCYLTPITIPTMIMTAQTSLCVVFFSLNKNRPARIVTTQPACFKSVIMVTRLPSMPFATNSARSAMTISRLKSHTHLLQTARFQFMGVREMRMKSR